VDGTRTAGKLTYPVSFNMNEGTIHVWFYFDGTTAQNTLYGTIFRTKQGSGGLRNCFWLYTSTASGRNDLLFQVRRNDGSAAISQNIKGFSDISDGWHSAAVRWSTSAQSLDVFLDGQLLRSNAYPIDGLLPFDAIDVGCLDTTYQSNTLFDELLILPHAATEEEIKGWYEFNKPFIDQDEINYQASQITQLADRYSVKIEKTIDGKTYATGFVVGIDEDNISDFSILSDRFRIFNPESGEDQAVFAVDTTTKKLYLRADLIADGSILANHMEADAIKTLLVNAGVAFIDHANILRLKAERIVVGQGDTSGIVATKPAGGKLWHFDTSLHSTDGIKPLDGAVATLRPSEGRVGGAVAVEEGTTNLVPSNRLKFEGWTASSGVQVTLTQNVEFPEIGRNDATRIRTTGGTSTLKYSLSIERSIANQAYTGSVYIKNIGSKPVRFYPQLGSSVTVNPGEWTRAIASGVGNGTTNFQFRFQALNAGDALDFIAWGPQAERKPFATSFVGGSRAAGVLKYQAAMLAGESYTVSLWAKAHTNNPSTWQVLFDGRSLTGNSSSQSLLEFNTSGGLMVAYQNGVGNTVTRNTGYVLADQTDWHHYVLVFEGPRSGGIFRVYVDGVQVSSFLTSLYAPSSDPKLSIGSSAGNYWNGLLDELLILPYAATEEEIKAWYEMNAPFYDPNAVVTYQGEGGYIEIDSKGQRFYRLGDPNPTIDLNTSTGTGSFRGHVIGAVYGE